MNVRLIWVFLFSQGSQTCIACYAWAITALYILFRFIVNHQRRQWHPTPVLFPGKPYGQRSLVGCSPWGRWESGTTEWLHFHFSLSCNGEGNGNPLQCSCLENPRDGGAWWAAVYGVTQSWTRLKWLSSSIVNHSRMVHLTPFIPSWLESEVSSSKTLLLHIYR